MKNLAEVLALLVFFLIPLTGSSANLGYEETKVLLFIILTSILGLVWLYLLDNKKLQIKKSQITLISTGFIIVLALTSLTGIDPMRSFLGRSPYLQGWVLYLFLFLYFLIISSLQIPLKKWVSVISFSAALVSLSAILQASQLYLLHQSIPNYAGRVVSTFGQPNLYAGFLMITLPFVLLSKYRKIILSISIIAILVSYSRTAILLLGLLLGWQLVSKLKLRKVIIASSTLVILVASVFAFKNTTGLISSEVTYPQTIEWLIFNSPEKRVLIWPIFGELIGGKPLLGYGLENIPPAFDNFFDQVNFNRVTNPAYYSLRDLKIDRSHNLFLDLLMFSGILGLISWLILFVVSWKVIKNKTLKTVLGILFIWLLFQPPGIVQLLYFWTILGLVNQEYIDKGRDSMKILK